VDFVMDLAPMDPCPVNAKGRHALSAILPGDDTGDVTFFCAACGALRRVSVAGALSSSLDTLDAQTILASVNAQWETR
jgi:hypothetical protein